MWRPLWKRQLSFSFNDSFRLLSRRNLCKNAPFATLQFRKSIDVGRQHAKEKNKEVDVDLEWREFTKRKRECKEMVLATDWLERFHALDEVLRANPKRKFRRLCGAWNSVVAHREVLEQGALEVACNRLLRASSSVSLDDMYRVMEHRAEKNEFVGPNMIAAALECILYISSQNARQMRKEKSRANPLPASLAALERATGEYMVPLGRIQKAVKDREAKFLLDCVWSVLYYRYILVFVVKHNNLPRSLTDAEIQSILRNMEKYEVPASIMHSFLLKQQVTNPHAWGFVGPILSRCKKDSDFSLAFRLCTAAFIREQDLVSSDHLTVEEKAQLGTHARTTYFWTIGAMQHSSQRNLSEHDRTILRTYLREVQKMIQGDRRIAQDDEFHLKPNPVERALLPELAFAYYTSFPSGLPELEDLLFRIRTERVPLSQSQLLLVIKAHQHCVHCMEDLHKWLENEYRELAQVQIVQQTLFTTYANFLSASSKSPESLSHFPLDFVEMLFSKLENEGSAGNDPDFRVHLTEKLFRIYLALGLYEKGTNLILTKGIIKSTNVFNSEMKYWLEHRHPKQVVTTFADMQSSDQTPNAMSLDLLTQSFLFPMIELKSASEFQEKDFARLRAGISEAVANISAHTLNYKHAKLRPMELTLQRLLDACEMTNSTVEKERILHFAKRENITIHSNS